MKIEIANTIDNELTLHLESECVERVTNEMNALKCEFVRENFPDEYVDFDYAEDWNDLMREINGGTTYYEYPVII